MHYARRAAHIATPYKMLKGKIMKELLRVRAKTNTNTVQIKIKAV